MNQPAIPQDVVARAADSKDCAPGHRFLLYFPVWDHNFARQDNAKHTALQQVASSLPRSSRDLCDALVRRQNALFQGHPHGLRVEARSTAPFATGLGNEHPVENGFAFLTPYGLPYLAGSGVKGVLRRAAEELALDPGAYPANQRPTLLDVWWLFGFEAPNDECLKDPAWQRALEALAQRADLDDFIRQGLADKPGERERERYTGTVDNRATFLNNFQKSKDLPRRIHHRGALAFWDVFPEAKGMVVEIMTPHYKEYYFNGQPPHDAGQPNPVPFLAVPDGTDFTFHVTCAPQSLPESLQTGWKPLMEAVFTHAFDWLGFGAKTAVGYGVLEDRNLVSSLAPETTSEVSLRAQRITWEAAELKYTPNDQTLLAQHEGNIAQVVGKEASIQVLGDPAELEILKRRQKNKKPNIRRVEVEAKGNQFTLCRVFPAEG